MTLKSLEEMRKEQDRKARIAILGHPEMRYPSELGGGLAALRLEARTLAAYLLQKNGGDYAKARAEARAAELACGGEVWVKARTRLRTPRKK